MPTRARIATVCLSGRRFGSAEEARSAAAALLDRALACRPDLVCLPETFAAVGPAPQAAEDVPGPTIEMAAQRARSHRCYVIAPLLRRDGGRVMNSAVVLDRSGAVAGVYDKVHPVTSTPDYTVFEDGVTPGGAFPTFDLDFGRIGVQICFDVGYPEGWQQLADQGARLVFWPSAYNGGNPLQVYAALHGYYVVSSVQSDRSRIIDPCGGILAETDGVTSVAWWDVNLDFAVCHLDFNYSVADRIEAAFPGKVLVRTYADEGRLFIEPTDPAVTIARLSEAVRFETLRQYHDRHLPAYERARKGQAPEPQAARHGRRPMYSKE